MKNSFTSSKILLGFIFILFSCNNIDKTLVEIECKSRVIQFYDNHKTVLGENTPFVGYLLRISNPPNNKIGVKNVSFFLKTENNTLLNLEFKESVKLNLGTSNVRKPEDELVLFLPSVATNIAEAEDVFVFYNKIEIIYIDSMDKKHVIKLNDFNKAEIIYKVDDKVLNDIDDYKDFNFLIVD